MSTPGGDTSERDVAALIDAIKAAPERRDELVALLPENARVYDGRSSPEVARLRGYLLAAFEATGLPDSALQYVVSELDTGFTAYTIAGAARALRGVEQPTAGLAEYLCKAASRLRGNDAAISFETYDARWPYREPTTGLTEVLRTIAWLGSNAAAVAPDLEALLAERDRLSPEQAGELEHTLEAVRTTGTCGCGDACACEDCSCSTTPAAPQSEYSCCDDMAFIEQFQSSQPAPDGIPNASLQDQDGAAEHFDAYFRGKPAVVAFFYTRCENPYKCSATVTRLGELQTLIDQRGLDGSVSLAAITYDAPYDLPQRLKQYGTARGVRFGDGVRFFRTTEGFDEMRRWFHLGVNYSNETVNQHQVEVYVLDAAGQIAASFTRLQWQPSEVLAAVEPLLQPVAP